MCLGTYSVFSFCLVGFGISRILLDFVPFVRHGGGIQPMCLQFRLFLRMFEGTFVDSAVFQKPFHRFRCIVWHFRRYCRMCLTCFSISFYCFKGFVCNLFVLYVGFGVFCVCLCEFWLAFGVFMCFGGCVFWRVLFVLCVLFENSVCVYALVCIQCDLCVFL